MRGLGVASSPSAGRVWLKGLSGVELGTSRPNEANYVRELCEDGARWRALVRVALREVFLADLVWLAARPSNDGSKTTWAGQRRPVRRRNPRERRQIGEKEEVR